MPTQFQKRPTMNYVEVAIPFFILAMVVEFAYGHFAKQQTYRLSDTVNSLQPMDR